MGNARLKKIFLSPIIFLALFFLSSVASPNKAKAWCCCCSAADCVGAGPAQGGITSSAVIGLLGGIEAINTYYFNQVRLEISALGGSAAKSAAKIGATYVATAEGLMVSDVNGKMTAVKVGGLLGSLATPPGTASCIIATKNARQQAAEAASEAEIKSYQAASAAEFMNKPGTPTEKGIAGAVGNRFVQYKQFCDPAVISGCTPINDSSGAPMLNRHLSGQKAIFTLDNIVKGSPEEKAAKAYTTLLVNAKGMDPIPSAQLSVPSARAAYVKKTADALAYNLAQGIVDTSITDRSVAAAGQKSAFGAAKDSVSAAATAAMGKTLASEPEKAAWEAMLTQLEVRNRLRWEMFEKLNTQLLLRGAKLARDVQAEGGAR